VNISQGMPTVSQITSALKGAFIGAGLVRYGPWSGEIDIQWVSADASKGLPSGPFDVSRSLSVDTSLVRVAHGVGYEVYNGAIGSVPTTLDARAGFAWFHMSETLDLDATGPLGRQRGHQPERQQQLRAALAWIPRCDLSLAALALRGWRAGAGLRS
jgi:hypothetical protein